VKRYRVLLGDDHTLLVVGLRKILEAEFEVVATVTDGNTLVNEALRLKPDVVLADISMPLLNGIEAARRIRRSLPEVKIAFLTMHADLTYLRDAFRLGATGYILKRTAGTELLKAVHDVAHGRTYVAPDLTQTIADPRLRHAIAQGKIAELTARQSEILCLVAQGRSHAEIGAALNISARTVRFHRSAIERKLGVFGTAALTRYTLSHPGSFQTD
jgi:DNA-binding NarL/FixJ family response regulator